MQAMAHSVLSPPFKIRKGITLSRPFGLFTSRRTLSDYLRPSDRALLNQWKDKPPIQTSTDNLSVEHLSDLYITLPTRDGTATPYVAPEAGDELPFGHHLAFFHARRAEKELRRDGTDEDISPPSPFTKRMWAGGRITWNNESPLLVGTRTQAISTVANAVEKGSEKGKPMIFVSQKIEYRQNNQPAAVTEERDHVYFHAEIFANMKKKFDREGMVVPNSFVHQADVLKVKDIPTRVDFSFSYTPSPVTLFRYSALMFNAHHIHLDKEYCEKEEGYPGG